MPATTESPLRRAVDPRPRRARPEPRWPASLAVLGAVGLELALPEKLTLGPRWVLPAMELALLVPLTAALPHRPPDESGSRRAMAIGLIALVNVANVVSLALLVHLLLVGGRAEGRDLLLSSIGIWGTNVIIFSLWYWELDGGGPGARTRERQRAPDFLFPQMTNPDQAPPGWMPSYLDYLYTSFTNATAFSPTDTMPLSLWAKMLMLVQASASLITVALVAARAVNILG